MKTFHEIFFTDSREMHQVNNESVQLVVTSPPYPMIAMWDQVFTRLDKKIGKQIRSENGSIAFELMHKSIDPVWEELWRILAKGGLACINVGDATRKIGHDFSLYPNHARILSKLMALGFTPLPAILWRKPTNAPTKFMGSGMLPAGAYVTLEHEYILIVRKGGRREFKSSREKRIRRQSALFWEERNDWYSDVWMNVIGTGQNMISESDRERSAAFPFDIPYRLISMFSVKGDTVLDPFAGTGTTLKAAAVAGRNSLGFDLETGLHDVIFGDIAALPQRADHILSQRVRRHLDFIEKCKSNGRRLKHMNKPYQMPVVTSQETDLFINPVKSARMVAENSLEVAYETE